MRDEDDSANSNVTVVQTDLQTVLPMNKIDQKLRQKIYPKTQRSAVSNFVMMEIIE